MRKNNKNQRRSLLFSTAIVAAGCLVTGIYVNQTMNRADDYKLDLSQLDAGENANRELVGNAGAAIVNGSDVVNPVSVASSETKTEDVNKSNKSGETEDVGKANEGKEADETKEAGETKETDESKEFPEENATQTNSASVVNKEAVALSFSPEDGMSWPIIGDVILNYSMDSAVFFSTLEQYKYNPAILIGANQGDTVSACAKGKVTKIGKDNEIGTYVTLSLGNGYEVTCGQLEELQVEEGDIVARGQVIGNVAKTTKYYTVEGDHVYLKITKDGEPLNPLDLMQ